MNYDPEEEKKAEELLQEIFNNYNEGIASSLLFSGIITLPYDYRWVTIRMPIKFKKEFTSWLFRLGPADGIHLPHSPDSTNLARRQIKLYKEYLKSSEI